MYNIHENSSAPKHSDELTKVVNIYKRLIFGIKCKLQAFWAGGF